VRLVFDDEDLHSTLHVMHFIQLIRYQAILIKV